jgi:hypothetical protein
MVFVTDGTLSISPCPDIAALGVLEPQPCRISSCCFRNSCPRPTLHRSHTRHSAAGREAFPHRELDAVALCGRGGMRGELEYIRFARFRARSAFSSSSNLPRSIFLL